MEQKERKYGIFISYCHEDAKLVSPITKLLGAIRKDLVFQDTKDIEPGEKWEEKLVSALDEAEIVIVFWCKHSAKSKYVRKEYNKAIKTQKKIIPVLLDDTPLVRRLKKYEFSDWREIIVHFNISQWVTYVHTENILVETI